jgi:hypothetical protein
MLLGFMNFLFLSENNCKTSSAVDPCISHPTTKVAGSSSDLNCSLCSYLSVLPHMGHCLVAKASDIMDIRDFASGANDTSFDDLGHGTQLPDIRGNHTEVFSMNGVDKRLQPCLDPQCV